MYLNGEEATTEAIRRLALLNYGNFTSMIVTTEGVRGLDLHLQRLREDSMLLHGVAVDSSTIRNQIRIAVTDQPMPTVARVTIFPSDTAGQLDVLVTTRPVHAADAPMRVALAQYQRELPVVKHVGLFGAMHQRRLAQLKGFDDVLFADNGSVISEGATWNVGFFSGDSIIWTDGVALPGVTERLLHAKLLEDGVKSVRRPVSVADLADFQAAFATNAVVGVRAINAIDDVQYSIKSDVFDLLRRSYDEVPQETL